MKLMICVIFSVPTLLFADNLNNFGEVELTDIEQKFLPFPLNKQIDYSFELKYQGATEVVILKELARKKFVFNAHADQIAGIELRDGIWTEIDEIKEILNHFNHAPQDMISLHLDKVTSVELENGIILDQNDLDFYSTQENNNIKSFTQLYKKFHQLDNAVYFTPLVGGEGTTGGGGGGR